MIEFVSFGAGFRQDGPDWGLRARPYLEGPWRRLSPGIHDLDRSGVVNTIHNRLTVLADGQGILTRGLDPQMQVAAEHDPSLNALFGPLSDDVHPIDALDPVVPVFNLTVPDMEANHARLAQDALSVLRLIRLTGLIRYNP